jgi:hypothetical protein
LGSAESVRAVMIATIGFLAPPDRPSCSQRARISFLGGTRNQGLVHARGGRDRVDPGRIVASFREDPLRGLEDTLLVGFLLRISAPSPA